MTQYFAWLFGMVLCGCGMSLTGQVLVGVQGQTPAQALPVKLGPASISRTNDRGEFSLRLPPSSRTGERIKVEIDKPGWCILFPFNGEVALARDPSTQRAVQLRVLRSERKQGPAEDCISQMLVALADRPNTFSVSEASPQPLDIQRELALWAEKQGLQVSEKEAEAALDRWRVQVRSRRGNDRHLMGLWHFAQKHFLDARRLFTEAAQNAEKDLPLTPARQGVVENYRLAGAAAVQEGYLDGALTAYGKALEALSFATDPARWAAVQVDLGQVHLWRAFSLPPGRACQDLAAATSSLREALKVYTREQQAQRWALTQLSLGVASLQQQDSEPTCRERRLLLAESELALRLALQVYTEEQQPELWALTQKHLGRALYHQAVEAQGADRARLVDESVAALRQALGIYTKKQQLLPWAYTRVALGRALSAQGGLLRGRRARPLYEEAVRIIRPALHVYTRQQQPARWAWAQTQLGHALSVLGVLTPGAQGASLLDESIQTFRLTLQVYTQANKVWPSVELGWALYYRDLRTEGEHDPRLLEEALEAANTALAMPPTSGTAGQAELHELRCTVLLRRALRSQGAERERLLREATQAHLAAQEQFPNNEHIALSTVIMYEQLAEFDKAYAVLQGLVGSHSQHSGYQADFAEAHFLTGRFAETAERVAPLVANPELDEETKVCLRAVEIAALAALGDTPKMVVRLQALREALQAQTEEVEPGWNFDGIKLYVEKNVRLARKRAWLLALFTAMERRPGAARLVAVDALIKQPPGW